MSQEPTKKESILRLWSYAIIGLVSALITIVFQKMGVPLPIWGSLVVAVIVGLVGGLILRLIQKLPKNQEKE